jgi:hypothetical protein
LYSLISHLLPLIDVVSMALPSDFRCLYTKRIKQRPP